MLEMVIHHEAAGEIGRRAAGMAGPNVHDPVKTDIDHDAADIEQQHVGGTGGEGCDHPAHLHNGTDAGNTRSQGAVVRVRHARVTGYSC